MAKILLNVEINQDYKQTLAELQKEVDKVLRVPTKSTSINELQRQYAGLLNNIKNVEKYYAKGTFAKQRQEVEAYLAKIRELNSLMQKGDALNDTEKQRLEQLQGELKGASQAYDNLNTEVKTLTATQKNNHGSLMEIVKGFATFQASAMLVMKPLQLIRSAWNSVNETLVKTEDAVIALQRVAGSSANADELYDLAQRYGQTFENVNEIALNFARSGMDWNDTIKATESALLALNVAELDATQASDGMIAIMQQFGKDADELTSIVDKLNITADNAAVSTDKLLTALQRTGSSAVNANLSLEETIGIVTALSEATGRSGENIGTAVNSLIQFSTKASSLEVFEGLGGKVAETVEAYRHGSADVLDIWRELSNVVGTANSENESILGGLFGDGDWQSLNEELQTALGENFATVNEIYGTASTFRKNYFIALLNNLDQVQESMDKMDKATGYSQAENEQYLDTYTAKVNALQTKWQDIANDEQGLLGIKKDLVDLGSRLLDLVKTMGGLKSIVRSIVVAVAPIIAVKTINGLISGVKTLWGLLKGIKGTFATIQGLSGWIGAILSVASLITGFIDGANTKELERQADSISGGTDNLSKLADDLEKIDEKYNNLEETIRGYRAVLADESSGQDEVAEAEKGLLSIQKDLLESNKDYKDGLDLINGALDEQLKKTEELDEQARFNERKKAVDDYLKNNAQAFQDAKNYLAETSTSIEFGEGHGNWDGTIWKDMPDLPLRDFLEKQGYSVEYNSGFWEGLGSFFTNSKVFKTTLTGEEELTRDERIALLNELQKEVDKIEDYDLNQYLTGQIQTALQNIADETYVKSNNLLYGNEKAQSWEGRLSEEQLNEFAKATTLEEQDALLVKWGLLKGEDTSSGSGGVGDTLIKTLDNLNDTLKDKILTELEALRSTEEKSNALEEKRQALENARNQRNVRVFNAETGQWEQVANQKDIQKAEEAYGDEAFKQVEELLKDENRSTEAMVQLLATIAGVMPEISEKAKELISESGIDLNEKSSYGSFTATLTPGYISSRSFVPALAPTYDSGGVLSGLGGIKATTKDEIVLPPNIAEKILKPTSNEQFRNFTKSLGILFGASERVGTMSPNSVIHNRGGDTYNNGGNTTQQYINGVQIPQDAQRYTIAELFEAMALTNNN